MLYFGAPDLYIKFLKERMKTLEKQGKEIAEELRIVEEQLSALQVFIEPKVSISISKMPNGKDRYIGRFMGTFPDGTVKQVSINLGPTNRFTGKEDPELKAIAQKKAIERFSRINPDYLIELFKTKNIDTHFKKSKHS
jgi:hypothetical protein